MKKITLLSILCMFLTIPIVVGQSSISSSGISGSTIQNSPPGTASRDYQNTNYTNNLVPVVITHSTSQNIVPGTASCGTAGIPAENNYYRDFDLSADFGITDDFTVSNVEFGVESIDGPVMVTLNIYSSTATFPTGYPSSLTLQGSSNYTVVTADNGSVVSVPLTATIPAGSKMVYEFNVNPGATNSFYLGSNNLGQTGTSWIQAAACGINVPTPGAGIGFPDMHLVMNVVGEENSGGGGPVVYCSGSGGSQTWEYITNVTYSDINNTTTTHAGYNDFTAQIANVIQGETNEISVTISADSDEYLYAFIDWNQNGILDDAGEVYTLATATSNDGPFTMNIPVPADAAIGDTRMRIKLGYDLTAPDPCGPFSFGEVEDYTVNVQAPGSGGGSVVYCIPEGTNSSRFINNFSTTGGNDNISNMASGFSPDGYGDFYDTNTVSQEQGGTVDFDVDIMGGTAGFRAWVDWDQDGVFDTTEEVAYSSSGYLTNHTGTVTVPADALAGDTRMRIVSHWLSTSGSVDPCETGFTYGEFEDYKFTVTASGGGGGSGPVIVCPTDITANNDPGLCSAVVNFSPAVAIDPVDGVIATTQTAGPTSGSDFPVGVTVVQFSATNSNGETSTCQFEVTVIDNEAPIAICQDITIDLDPVTGLASITAADVDNGSTDNCSIDSMSIDISTFDCSMIGPNTVTLTVTDNVGNSFTCTSTVTVQDVTAPEVTCVGGFNTFTESEDFEGASVPAGWTTNIVSGGWDWSFGSGDMPTGADFPTNAAIFDDDAAGSGESQVAELLSPTYDLSLATSAEISFDYANQVFGGGILSADVFDGTDWQEVFSVDTNVDPTNTGAIDVTAYINANFQVRYTYDDEGEWSWGAGVDNFLLSYQAASGDGLDVYLDANGQATISPNDLVLSVIEACNYTITASGVGGGTQGSLTTMFASGNNGDAGGAVYFDITVGAADIEITDIDISTDADAFTMDVYTIAGTSVGNETNQGAWTLSSTASGIGVGQDAPSNAELASPITLSANTTYGMALVLDGAHSHYYTNGDGTNENFSNDDLSLALGAASNVPFTAGIFSPRIFNGTINYIGGPGSGLDFTCADLGQNLVEVTVTDDSGNSSTCIAVVNVIDNIAPVITCAGTPGPVSYLEDFEGTTIPDGWSTVIETGVHDWSFGSGTMPTGGNFPSRAAIFNDDAAGSGEINKATLISPVYDISLSSTAGISFDYAFQDYLGDGILTVEVFDGAAWQEVMVIETSTPPINSGVLDVTAHLNANFQVRFIYDDEGGWSYGAGIDNFKVDYEITTVSAVDIALGADGTASIDPYSLIQSLDEACGISTVAVDTPVVTCADIGQPITVTIFVSDTSGNVSSCTALINVIDTIGPEITCPADQTIDPGAGNLFYIVPDYFATGEAMVTDNCTDPVIITSQDPVAGAAITDGVHTVTLTAEDEYGNVSTCSFELTIESIVVGIDDNKLETGLSLYPNPAKNVVNLVNKTNISLDNMVIFDINGKKINQIDLRTMQGEKSVDISNLSSGVYVIQIVGETASTIKRLIVE